ncbi:MAG: M15 family metallopeptidase [Parcubacteria group bacterium]|nr:M15 family metallopeptidase [Parcubacteria group bacterium]
MEIANNLIDFSKKPIEKRRGIYVPLSLRREIPIKDCGEELVTIENFFTSNGQKVFLSPVWGKNDIPVMLLRQSAVEKLSKAAQKIDRGYFFKVTDAYRPVSLQRKLFGQVCEEVKLGSSHLSEEEIKTKARRFVADPDFGIPPHSTGGAVDLTLVDEFGNELDMGTKIDALDDRVETLSSRITPDQMSNRMFLLESMEKEGFVNLASEWWHYSYGDQYWAAFHGKPAAIYDSL